MTLTPALLAAVGTSLYGSQYQSQLARDLQVSPRTVQRWLNGRFPIPLGIPKDLATICETRANSLMDWADRLDPLPQTAPEGAAQAPAESA